MKSAASIEMGAATVSTSRPSGSAIAVPRTWMPEPDSSRSQASTKLLRYRSVWKDTTSAPSSPTRICSRHGSRAKMSDGGQGTCRKNPIGCSGRRPRMNWGTSIRW